LIGDEELGEGLFIDPADETDMLLSVAASYGMKIKYVVNTHSHIDHVMGNAEMVVHRLTDDGPMDAIGPSVTDEMFDTPHQSFFVNQYSQQDLPLKGVPRSADGLDGLHRGGQV
jgi:glyoxylase-like metal-dependent hydrolase (beta-lactamase superfamily II)